MAPRGLLAPLQLLGALNLLTAFPQLATGLLIAKYASRPSEEFERRGYPGQLLDVLSAAARAVDADTLNELLSALRRRRAFLDAYVDHVSSRAAGRGFWERSLLLTFAEALRTEGLRLAAHLLCLEAERVEEAASTLGLSIDVLREADAGFRYTLRHEDPDDPTSEYVEEYVCGPAWLTDVVSELASRLSNVDVPSQLASHVRGAATGDVECYATMRAAAFHGLRGLEGAAERVDECLEPFRRGGHLHVGALLLLRRLMVDLERELYGAPPEGFSLDERLGVYRRGTEVLVYGYAGLVTLALAGEDSRAPAVTAVTRSAEEAELISKRAPALGFKDVKVVVRDAARG